MALEATLPAAKHNAFSGHRHVFQPTMVPSGYSTLRQDTALSKNSTQEKKKTARKKVRMREEQRESAANNCTKINAYSPQEKYKLTGTIGTCPPYSSVMRSFSNSCRDILSTALSASMPGLSICSHNKDKQNNGNNTKGSKIFCQTNLTGHDLSHWSYDRCQL